MSTFSGDLYLMTDSPSARQESARHRKKLREKAGGMKKARDMLSPRKQLDLGKITPDELEEQKEHLRRRVLAWLSGIPIGGNCKEGSGAKRYYDTRPICRFAESWNLYHVDIEEIYAKTIDAQMAEAEIEAQVGSGRRRGQAEAVDAEEEEEGAVRYTLLLKANELVPADKKVCISAKTKARLLLRLRERLGLDDGAGSHGRQSH